MSVCQGKQSYSIDKFEDVIDLGHEAFDHNMFIYVWSTPHPVTVTN